VIDKSSPPPDIPWPCFISNTVYSNSISIYSSSFVIL
jgi:hypothetical protein